MTEEVARVAVRVTLSVMARLAERTRTTADDMLLQILRSNERKLAAAVLSLSGDPAPPTPERVNGALATVGIHV